MRSIEAETAAHPLGDVLTPWTSGVNGWWRPYGQVHSHMMIGRPPAAQGVALPLVAGEMPVEVLRNPMLVMITSARSTAQLAIDLTLTNAGAGHSLPTGTPGRAWFLLVEAEAAGKRLQAIGGYSVPAWGGARVQGILGSDGAVLAGASLTLPGGKILGPADLGRAVRFVAASGEYDDYPATRYFGEIGRTASEKGMPVMSPVEEATIIAVNGAVITLDHAPVVPLGTLFYVGDVAPAASFNVDDGTALAAYAGAPGYAFGKIMVDAAGTDAVPFFRATGIRSDNRIPAGKTALTKHVFDVSSAAGQAITVRVTLLYRRQPYGRAVSRGWTDLDLVRYRQELVVAP
jgi:hypothetical protein